MIFFIMNFLECGTLNASWLKEILEIWICMYIFYWDIADVHTKLNILKHTKHLKLGLSVCYASLLSLFHSNRDRLDIRERHELLFVAIAEIHAKASSLYIYYI